MGLRLMSTFIGTLMARSDIFLCPQKSSACHVVGYKCTYVRNADLSFIY